MRSRIQQILTKNLFAIGSISPQTSFSSGGAQQSEETALRVGVREAKVFRCSVDGTSIDLRITISTECDLGHEDWFIRALLTSLSIAA